MYDEILYPTDGSETAEAGFSYALDVAAAHDATVHVLTVADTTRDSVTRIGGEVVDVLEREGERVVAAAAEHARERGVTAVTDVRQGAPGETIVGYAERADVDLVVMPTHGRSGLERVLLGSVTERVVNASPVPVLAVTPEEGRAFVYPARTILVPTDGSEDAERALETAVDLATETGAALHVLHVVETAGLGSDVRSALERVELAVGAEDVMDAARETTAAAGLGSVTTEVREGAPHREIRAYVDEHDVDLVALGARGQTDFSRYILGGVTEKLLRTSPVPVLLVR